MLFLLDILDEAEFGEAAMKLEYDENSISPASELGFLVGNLKQKKKNSHIILILVVLYILMNCGTSSHFHRTQMRQVRMLGCCIFNFLHLSLQLNDLLLLRGKKWNTVQDHHQVTGVQWL